LCPGVAMKARRILRRTVLQIRLVRRQSARRGRGQRVGRVDAVGLGIDVGRQRVGVGRFQLRDLAPLQDLPRELVALLGEFVEHLSGGRPRAGLGLGAARQSHLAEQDVADLLRAADIDRLARDLLDLGFDTGRSLGEVAGETRQHLTIDRDAAPLHACEHRDQRAFQRLVDRGHVLGDEARLQHAPDAQGHVGAFRRQRRGLVDRHLVERDLALAAAEQLVVFEHRVTEPALGQLLQRVRAAAGIEHVGDQLRIIGVAQCDAVLRQHHRGEFDFEADLENAW
jgi:hypothetical protein